MITNYYIYKGISIGLISVLLQPLYTQADNASCADSKQPNIASTEEADKKISFEWRPKHGPSGAYKMDEEADRHKIIIFNGADKTKCPTVLIGFHGQPSRGKAPRDYAFAGTVEKEVRSLLDQKAIEPVVLVLPVFRFVGQNWPGFDLVEFKAKITKILASQQIVPKRWYLFGHSGAAGCGGDGLNQAVRISPDAVGFFDTCLGTGWQEAAKALTAAKIPTLHLYSVETAGFRPKQRPEYQAEFDFGRAFGPVGMKPIDCPDSLPDVPLRDQPYRCAASPKGKSEAFILNTGEGVEAHTKLLPAALRFFLKRFLSP